MEKLIIGITGTLGAGKGTVVDYLIKNYNFKHYSASEFITKEIINQNLEVNRDSMQLVADNLRKNHSPSYVVDSLYNSAILDNNDSIIESIRCPGEIDSLRKNKNFILLAIDANSKIRYKRVLLRKSLKDNIDYEKFLSQEKAELDNKEPFKMNLFECIKKADYKISNNSDFDDLYKQIDEIMKIIKNKNKE